MHPMFVDLNEIGFAFTSERQTFEVAGNTYQIMWGPFRSPEDVRVEIDPKGHLFVGPATSQRLGWRIYRDVFMSAVTMLREAGVNDLRGDDLLVGFPAGRPDVNVAVSRTVFNRGAGAAYTAIREWDIRAGLRELDDGE